MGTQEWTDDGAVHETHPLKRRPAKAIRPVPVPPVLVRTLRDHIDRFGVAADERIFQNAAGVYGQFVDYYRGRGGRAEVPEMSLPGHTLSWDPVRDRESYLMVEEPDSCPVGGVPVTRCVREPAEETVAAVRERYGMVFKLELGSPEYYKVSR